MRFHPIVLIPWIFAALSLRAAEPAAGVDPMLWEPPTDKAPLFVERIPIAEYSIRLVKARARAAELEAKRAALPLRGQIVERVARGQALMAGMEFGDILISLDDKPLVNPDDINKFRTETTQTLKYYSQKRGPQTMSVQPGKIGTNVQSFDRNNPLDLDGKLDDPRWAEEIHLAGLLYMEDPEFAETALARAVGSGLPRTPLLMERAARLAFRMAHYDQSMAIAWQALAEAKPDVPKARLGPIRFYFFNSAMADYKLEAALNMARKSEDPYFTKHIPVLEQMIAAHKALPAEVRLAPSPREMANHLYYDDLMVRLKQSPPLTYHGTSDNVIAWEKYCESQRNALCANQPVGFAAPPGSFDEFGLLPAVKNMHFQCRFVAEQPAQNLSGFAENFVFSFVSTKPAADGCSYLVGLQYFPERLSPWGWVYDRNTLQIAFDPLPFDRSAEFSHVIDFYAANGKFEAYVDNKRVMYVPMDSSDDPKSILFNYNGLNVKLLNLGYFELLTVDERMARVDPDISKPYTFGWTRLHRAVQFFPANYVAELLTLKPNLDLQDDQGGTPLMLAVTSKRLDLVKLLIEKGAKVDLVNKESKTAYQLAQSLEVSDIADYILKTHPELKTLPALDKPLKPVKPPKPPENDF